MRLIKSTLTISPEAFWKVPFSASYWKSAPEDIAADWLKSFGDYIGQQTTGQQNALGSWGRFLTTKAGAQGATDAANAQLDQTKTLMDTNSRLGFAGQLQAGRNDAWTKRFMKEHPNAYQGGAGGSSSSSWGASTDPEALNKIAQAFQDKMNGIATTSTTTTPTTQPDIPYPH